MLKREEQADPGSCWNKARDDEAVFVLLGRDPAFGPAIRCWAAERINQGKNKITDAQIREAMELAARVDAEQLRKERAGG